jgi:hypothetical protein
MFQFLQLPIDAGECTGFLNPDKAEKVLPMRLDGAAFIPMEDDAYDRL